MGSDSFAIFAWSFHTHHSCCEPSPPMPQYEHIDLRDSAEVESLNRMSSSWVIQKCNTKCPVIGTLQFYVELSITPFQFFSTSPPHQRTRRRSLKADSRLLCASWPPSAILSSSRQNPNNQDQQILLPNSCFQHLPPSPLYRPYPTAIQSPCQPAKQNPVLSPLSTRCPSALPSNPNTRCLSNRVGRSPHPTRLAK